MALPNEIRMPEFESMASAGPPVVAVLLLLVTAAGFGSLLRGGPRGSPSFDLVLLRLIAGINLVGLAGVGLGTLRLLPAERLLWVLAGFGVLAFIAVSIRMRAWKMPPLPPRAGATGIWPYLALAVLGLITLGPSLCLPSAWDELVYHCVLPRRWLEQGWPAVYPDLPYSGFPSLGEILFWLMAPVNSLIAPRLLVWACWMLGLLCLFRLLRRRLPGGSAATLTLVFATSGIVLLISADCYVEGLLMMNVAALLLAFDVLRPAQSGETELWRAAILGVLAGGAVAVKPTGGGVLGVPLLLYAGEALGKRMRWTEAGSLMALSLALALAVSVPFYLRPWMETGTPLYPYLCEWFSDDPGRIEMSRYHHEIGGAVYGIKSAVGLVASPILLAFQNQTFDGRFGWQLLLLLLLAAVALGSAARRSVRSTVTLPAAISVWLYLFWFATAQQARFVVPAVLVLTVVAAEGLRLTQGKWRGLAILVLALAALTNLPERAGYYWYSWLAVSGDVSRRELLDAATERRYLSAVEAVATRTPPDSRVMLVFEHRSLYIPRECRIGTPLFQERFFSPVARYAEPDRILKVLAEERFTHVLLATDRVGPDRAPGADGQLAPFLRALNEGVRLGRLEPVWQSEHHVLLRMRG